MTLDGVKSRPLGGIEWALMWFRRGRQCYLVGQKRDCKCYYEDLQCNSECIPLLETYGIQNFYKCHYY